MQKEKTDGQATRIISLQPLDGDMNERCLHQKEGPTTNCDLWPQPKY